MCYWRLYMIWFFFLIIRRQPRSTRTDNLFPYTTLFRAFDPQVLEFLGRAHSGDEARAAIAAAQEHFARVSFDLIYARPGQSLAAWEAELGAALAFGTGHLSLYQLTIEPGTRFATLAAKGEIGRAHV